MATTRWSAAQTGGGGGEAAPDRATAAGAGARSPVEKAVCGNEGVDTEPGGDDTNASGALGGFALNARPTASQSCATEGTRSKGNDKQKGDTSNELRKGTFLKRLDTRPRSA